MVQSNAIQITVTPPPSYVTVILNSPSISQSTVTIGGSATTAFNGAVINAVYWIWGDGSTSTGSFPQTHTYTSTGIYTISVYASDTAGNVSQTVTTIATLSAITRAQFDLVVIQPNGYQQNTGTLLYPPGSPYVGPGNYASVSCYMSGSTIYWVAGSAWAAVVSVSSQANYNAYVAQGQL